jgi:hypothetical protein
MTIEVVKRHKRILAVDLRARWLGYAVFEVPTRLLDFGLVRVSSVGRKERHFTRLLEWFRPRLVLMRGGRLRSGTRAFQRSVVQLSARLSMPVERVSNRALGRHFHRLGLRNKEQRASILARQFPELSWKVPPPRKRWQHEHQNMPIFDAVAVGVAHLEMRNKYPG